MNDPLSYLETTSQGQFALPLLQQLKLHARFRTKPFRRPMTTAFFDDDLLAFPVAYEEDDDDWEDDDFDDEDLDDEDLDDEDLDDEEWDDEDDWDEDDDDEDY